MVKYTSRLNNEIRESLHLNTNGGATKHGQGWEDLVTPFAGLRGKGANEPVWRDMGNGIYGQHFSDGDALFAVYHTPHIYTDRTKAYPHVHWLCDIPMTSGDQVTWTISYVKGAIGESLTSTLTNVAIVYTADGTEVAGQHILSEVSDDDAFTLPEVDGLLLVYAEMTTSVVTGTEQIFGLMMDLHIETDGLRTTTKSSPYLKH